MRATARHPANHCQAAYHLGMVENDEVSGSDFADTPYVPTGPRRSTFTPPTVGPPSSPAQQDGSEAVHANGDEEGADDAGQEAGVEAATAGLPDRPRRRSLQDDELLRALSPEDDTHKDTLGTIEQLQEQLRLRQEEAREFGAWETRMRAIGTPEALDSVAQAIPEFTGVIPIVSSAQGATAPASPPERAAAPSEPTPSPPTPIPGELEQSEELPSFPPPRFEERVDAGPVEEPNLSDHLVFQPPWKRTPIAGEGASIGPAEPIAPAESEEPVSPEEPVGPDHLPEHDGAADAAGASEQATASEPALPSETPEPPDAAPEAAPIIYELVDPTSPVAIPGPAAFDALLTGTPEQAAEEEPSTFTLLHTPEDAEPAQTGSQTIIPPVVDTEPDDEVDETDRAFDELAAPLAVTSEGVAILPPTTGSAPIQPLASPRVPTDEHVILDTEPTKARLFSLETETAEATPLERRVGRAARMFWLWFATNASVVSVGFGAALFSLGMSLRQAILAAFIGVAISFLPLGLGTLAGKWSGQPTIVVSRATFGLAGNIVPAILTLVTRLFWGGVLLWLLSAGTARILVGASLNGPFDETQLSLLAGAVGFAIAFIVAFFGYPLFARLQLVLSIVSALLIIGLLVLTWHAVDIGAALTVGDGPWILVVTGVVLVFSFVGLVWANSSGDIARYQRPAGSGAAASLWASFGATLPAFLLIAYGALLAASSPETFAGLVHAPLDTIASMIPSWYPVPLIAATALSLLSGVAFSLYSGGFALHAIGLRLRRQWSVVVVGVLLLGITAMVALSGSGFSGIFRDIATSLAVPVAAWAGIFAAEMMIRRRPFDAESLLKPGGAYPAVNWTNLVMLFVASGLGFAFTSATVGWLSWQGYGFTLLGLPIGGEVAASDLGVLVALAIGLVTPLVSGVATIRRQEHSGH